MTRGSGIPVAAMAFYWLLPLGAALLSGCPEDRKPGGSSGDTQDETGSDRDSDSERPGDSDTSHTGDSDTGTGPPEIDIDEFAYLTFYGETRDLELGDPIVLGDVTGDGLDDLCIGPQWGGTSFCFRSPLGSGEVLQSDADFVMEALPEDGVGTPGDVNGDGFADLVQGASLYLGPMADLENDATADVSFLYDPEEYDVSSHQGDSGDSDGDGVPEVVLDFWDRYRSDRLMVFDNIESASVDIEDRVAEIDQVTHHKGWANSRYGFVGDLDGNGHDELSLINGNGIIYGPMGGVYTEVEAGVESSFAARGGDMNGDGYDDLLAVRGPRVMVFHGPIVGHTLTEDADATITYDTVVSSDYVNDATSPGDVDENGLPDILFGIGNEDKIFLFLSPIEGSLSAEKASLQFNGRLELLSMDGPFDLNEGGLPDLIIGDPGYNRRVREGGAVWILPGHGLL